MVIIPRRAALNSYAVGGVNAHIILEEYTSGSDPEPIKHQESVGSNESTSTIAANSKGLMEESKIENIVYIKEQLTSICEEVFKIEKVKENDNFFELGGNFH